MEGINTPAVNEPMVPILPQTGLQGILVSFLSSFFNILVRALTWGALQAWEIFVQFLDTIASTFGYPGLFSKNIIPAIANFFSWFVSSLSYIVTLLTQIWAFIGTIFVPFITFLVQAVTYWVKFITFVINIFTGAIDGTIDLWTSWNGSTWVTLACLLYPVYIFVRVADEDSLDPLVWHAERWKDIVSFLITIFKTMIELTIRLIQFVIESIPVVE